LHNSLLSLKSSIFSLRWTI